MIELTKQQREEVKNRNGTVIELIDPDTKQEYVLVPKEVYERMREDGAVSGPAPIILLAEWSGSAINNAGFTVRQITLDDLKTFAKTLDGQTLSTQFRDRRFTLTVTDNGLEYTPEISDTSHQQNWPKQCWQWIQRFLKRFNESRSPHPGDYKNARNASYLLTIIREYLAAHS
jgi:hypothetical protein